MTNSRDYLGGILPIWSVQRGVAKNRKEEHKLIREKMMKELNKSFKTNVLGNHTDGKKLAVCSSANAGDKQMGTYFQVSSPPRKI